MAYEVRAMSFAEILDTSFRLVRDHFVLLIGIAAVLYVPLGFASEMMVGSVEGAAASPDEAMRVALIAGGIGLVSIVLSPIVTAAITHALAERFLGRTESIGGALRVSVGLMLPLVGTFFLYMLAVGGGLLLLIVPGLYLLFAFMLVTPVMVIERIFGTKALGRSRELMRGNIWRGLGIMFVTAVLVTVLQTGVDLALASIPLVHPLFSGVVQAAGYAFYSAVGVIFYFDIRCRKEAFDLEHLARLVAQGDGPAPAETPAVS